MSTAEDQLYKTKWDDRYRDADYAYGKHPNIYFKQWIDSLEPGTVLMPADGEGRNGVYAAEKGWQVTSTDLSEEGKTKTLLLAEEKEVSLDYLVGDLESMNFEKESFDVIGLVYAHFTESKKEKLHQQLNQWLKPGGMMIFEAFSKNHLACREENPSVGGPADAGMLFSLEEVESYFPNYEVLYLREEKIVLREGNSHLGTGMVIRFTGIKQP